MSTTTESKPDLANLALRLPGTKFTCWGLAQGPTISFANELYHGTIAEVDPKHPLKMKIKDGNVIELQLNALGEGDHLVILDEPVDDGEGKKANLVCYVTVGYDVQKQEPVFLLDYMRDLANPQ